MPVLEQRLSESTAFAVPYDIPAVDVIMAGTVIPAMTRQDPRRNVPPKIGGPRSRSVQAVPAAVALPQQDLFPTTNSGYSLFSL